MQESSFLTRRPVLITTLAASALAFAIVSLAQSSPASVRTIDPDSAPEKHESQGGGHQKGGEEHESPLEQAMQKMQGAQKRLDKALEKKDLAAALPLIVDMEHAALAAKVETPPMADELTDAKKKAEFVNGFRKQLIALEKSLCDLETAALDGKADDAARIYESVIKSMKKEGHAKYKGD
jgi:hypothetical protein